MHVGRSSPHLMRRFRHVRQPVFVLFLIFGLVAAVDPLAGDEPLPAPVGDGRPCWVEAIWLTATGPEKGVWRSVNRGAGTRRI
jgi:hypothetical protein